MGKGSYVQRGVVLAVLLAGLIVLGFFLFRPARIPETGILDVDLPDLGVSDCAAWVAEPYRVLVLVKDGKVEARTSYEPEDGGPRARLLEPGEKVPWPADLPTEPETPLGDRVKDFIGVGPPPRKVYERPAIAIGGDGDALWSEVRGGMRGDRIAGISRVYLAGRPGAIPLTVVPDAEYEIARLGVALIPSDISGGIPASAVSWLRITRSGEAVRYRWGDVPWLTSASVRWEGDVRPEPGASTPEGLTARLSSRWKTPRGRDLAIVFLEFGLEVRFRDVIRAVRAADGDPDVCFFSLDRRPAGLKLPSPDPPGEHPFLTEVQPRFRRSTVIVLADGSIRLGGRLLEPREVVPALGPSVAILLRADESAPWSVCRTILRDAGEAGIPRQLCFAPEEPTLSERDLTLPDVPGGRRVGHRATPDAKAGDVFREILRLVEQGAEGIDFE